MLGQFINWLQISLNLFNQSTPRIVWNLFLAFIPLILSFYLFRIQIRRGFFWWILLLIFISFLPNAPYILTDSIHIIELSQDYPTWAVFLVLIPQYVLFILFGFEAYVVSLSRIEKYLGDFLTPSSQLMLNAIAHCLSVVGIYIGRFERFNSWDFVTRPVTVLLTTIRDLLDAEKLLSMAIAWLIIWLLSELVKRVNHRFIQINFSSG